MTQLVRWSYSTWALGQKCMRAVKHAAIDKIKQPENDAMRRGTRIHKEAELYLNRSTKIITKDLMPFARELKELRKAKPVVEQFWNFTPDFGPAKPYKGTLVLKADAVVPPNRDSVAHLIDHKTGRYYESHDAQADLSAVSTWARYPDTEEVIVEFWYYDQPGSGSVRSSAYLLKKLKALRRYWMEEGARMMAERRFLSNPSEDACKWCPYRTDKGGPCPDWKKLRSVSSRR